MLCAANFFPISLILTSSDGSSKTHSTLTAWSAAINKNSHVITITISNRCQGSRRITFARLIPRSSAHQFHFFTRSSVFIYCIRIGTRIHLAANRKTVKRMVLSIEICSVDLDELTPLGVLSPSEPLVRWAFTFITLAIARVSSIRLLYEELLFQMNRIIDEASIKLWNVDDER